MPKNRRSILATLTAEQETFLRPARKQRDVPVPDVSRSREPQTRVDGTVTKEANTASTNRARSLRSVTLRLTPDVAEHLRRTSIKRSLDYEEPFTQQAITEHALHELAMHARLSRRVS